jgi:Sensors of blue-light using FAD
MNRQIFYISNASLAFEGRNLEQILQISRRNNRRADLTGCLVYTGKNFAQALEGAEEALASTLTRIQADERHRHVRILLDRVVDRRAWPQWSMGYVHDLGLADSLDALGQGAQISADDTFDLLARMQPDFV